MTTEQYEAELVRLQKAVVRAPSWKARARAQADLRAWQAKNLEAVKPAA